MSAISIEWVHDPRRFEELGEAWDRLALIHDDPFASSAWLSAWWDAFAPGVPGRIAVAWRGGTIVGGLPLLECGDGLAAMANEHSPVFRLLAADEQSRQALI